MGLCASMLQRRARRRHPDPEPRRGTPTAMFVVRGDRRPEPLVFRVQDSGRAQLQKPPRKPAVTGAGRRDERRLQQSTDVPDMVNRARMTPRLSAGHAGAAEEPDAPSCTRRTTTAATAWYGTPAAMAPMTPGTPLIVPGTPASAAAMTPGRPVWQRRILMGTRCELPRFSGLVLYDEHGRRVQVAATPARRNHRQGKKKTATARSPSTATLGS